jgi:dUTPase
MPGLFLVDHEYQADYKVFFVEHSYQEKNAAIIKGLKLVDHEYQASVKVFIVDHEYQADIKILRENFPKR